MLTINEGVKITKFTFAGLQILFALEKMGDFVITSAEDGTHTGPDDPHHLANAFDVRSRDILNKEAVLLDIMNALDDGLPTESSGGYVTKHFFGWIEVPGEPNEHYHFQLRKGMTYP